MIYKSKNAGLLSMDNVKDGDKVKIIEDAYESFSEAKQQTYVNVKVELADGTHKLASIDGNFGADRFSEMWGDETTKWIGHFAKVSVKVARSGNPYLILTPIAGEAEPVASGLSDEEKKRIVELRKAANEPAPVEYPDGVNPDDIPF